MSPEDEKTLEEIKNKKIEQIVQEKIQEELKQKDKEINKLKKEIKDLKKQEKTPEKTESPTEMDRREFLKKAGLGAIGLGALTMSPTSALDIKDSNGLQVFDGTGTNTQALDINSGGPIQIKNSDLEIKGDTAATQNWVSGNFNNYTDTEAVDSAPVQSVNGQTGNVTIDTGGGSEITAYDETEFQNNIDSEINTIIDTPVLIGSMAASSSAMDAVSSSSTAMNAIISSSIAMDTLFNNSTAMDAVSSSSSAMDAVSSSSSAMDAVSSSSTARNTIGTSDSDSVGYTKIASSKMAIGKYVAGHAGETPSNFVDVDAVASNSTAMDAVSSSSSAMDAVSSSSSAMDAVSSSSTALNYIESNWNRVELSDGESPAVASIYLVEVKGGGGGGGHDGYDQDGGKGGDSSFGSAVAYGGEGGIENGSDGSCGGYKNSVSSPSVIVESSDCGGASGGNGYYDRDGDGGDGGYVKALVSNSSGDSVSASVGGGGSANQYAGSGDSGSVVVWVPPWAPIF